MDFFKNKFLCIVFIGLLLAWTAFFGCAPKRGIPENVLNTPSHHTSSGFKLIKKGYLYDAEREFNLALELEPHYSPAYRGLGLVYGVKGDFNQAFKAMGNAMDYAKEREDQALACVGFMRLYTMRKGKGWLEHVEQRFLDAVGSVKDLPEAYYYMGIAYEKADRIPDSKKALKKVLQINQRLVPEASQALRRMEK